MIGDRVYVDGFRAASVAYFGEVQFASGDWVGVVLDEATGNHGGKLHGHEYFQCAALHGLFIRPHRVSRMPDSALGSSAASSRVSTPIYRNCLGRGSKSPASSIMDSYFYDEDYRQPTVASLERKLKLMHDKQQDYGSANVRQALETSGSGSRAGILKRSSRSQSTEPTRLSSTADQYRAASVASSHSSASRSPVFNFRPRRTPLAEFKSQSYSNSAASFANEQPSARINLSSEPAKLGDQVVVRTESGQAEGTLRYLGETEFATGEWAGIELARSEGKNDGSVLGHRYFYCARDRGLFVPAIRVRKYTLRSEQPEFKSVRCTIKSPPPKMSVMSSRSTTPISESPASPPAYSVKKAFSPADNRSKNPYEPLGQFFGSRTALDGRERPKFDEEDLERQVKKSLRRASYRLEERDYVKPRSIKYTFSSSKYNGNPIARRTVEYD